MMQVVMAHIHNKLRGMRRKNVLLSLIILCRRLKNISLARSNESAY